MVPRSSHHPAAIAGAAERAARLMVELAESKHAADVAVLDMRAAGLLTDVFIVCTGESTRQVKAIADAVWEGLEARGIRVRHLEGYHEAHWVLVDAGDAVIHVFTPPTRQFYDLERLWGDMPRLKLSPR